MSKNVQLFNNWLLTETLYLKLIRQKEYLKLMNFFPNGISIFNSFFGFVAKRNQNKYFWSYNLRQKIVDKFTKLSDIGFPLECFSTGFLRFSSTNVKICILGGQLGNRLQNPSNSGIILKRSFSNFCILFLFLFYNIVFVSVVVKRSFAKTWKRLQLFCPRFWFLLLWKCMITQKVTTF